VKFIPPQYLHEKCILVLTILKYRYLRAFPGKDGALKSRSVSLLALIFALAVAVAGCGGGGGGGGDTGGSGGGDGGGTTAAVGGAKGGDPVTVASDIAYRPFEFTQDGEPVGFDIDLMNEIGERANLQVEFQNVTFDGIIPGLTSGLYGAAISAMTITEERAQQVDFSDPYFNADQSLLVKSGSDIQSTNDLADKTVGVQLGTTGAMEAQNLANEDQVGNVRTFDTVEDAFTALENGQVDAVINDFPVSADRVQTSNGSLEIVQTIPTGEQYGIALPKDSELTPRVNEALQEIKDDGTYAEIYEKWFGQAPEQIPS
jgi:ABC-type amino acid transport substrate-binding protein